MMRELDDVLTDVDIQIKLAARNYSDPVPYSSRVGVMWHFDASRSDNGAIGWFDHPDFLLSYNRAYTDNGRRIGLTPTMKHRAYHGGTGRTDARVKGLNSAFYGLCITADDGQVATEPQFNSIVVDTIIIAKYHQLRGDRGWETSNIGYWLTGHENWAIYGPKDTKRKELWGKLGRKKDPTGSDRNAPVLSLVQGRKAVAAILDDVESAPKAFWSSFDFGVPV